MGKLYTARGDKGDTNLMGARERVRKDHARVVTLGEIDELNAAIGLALEAVEDAPVRQVLLEVQNTLFTVGAEIAVAKGAAGAKGPRVRGEDVASLERWLEEYDLGEIKEFVLPRGPGGAAALHFARAVARRVERAAVSLARKEPVGPDLLAYLNRLSSLLFALAVWTSRKHGGDDRHPTYKG